MENDRQVILVVLAHPDDETFGMGGTLALYASRGARVFLVCATRGEVGEIPEGMMEGFESVGALRESELRNAAAKLGLAEIFFLNYRDSGMPGSPDNRHPQALAAQPLEQVAAGVAHFIRKLHPQVVLTFDPIGGYRHPDHIAIQRATVRAFTLAGDASFSDPEGLSPFAAQRLFYHLMPRGYLRWVVLLAPLVGRDPRHFGQNGDIDLTSLVEEDFPVHAVINYRQAAQAREEASACHASQGGGSMVKGPMKVIMRLFNHRDAFMLAIPAQTPSKRLRDLFEEMGSES